MYIAASAAPALYFPPVLLALLLMTALLVLLVDFETVLSRKSNSFPPYFAPLSMLLLYMLASGLGSGVSLSELLSYEAVRYDANILYSTLPLFLLSSGQLTLNRVEAWVKQIAIWGAIAYVVMPSIGIIPFESHNAAGGFFMILLAFMIGRALEAGLGGRWVPIGAALMALILSDSRGSIVAVAAAVMFILLHRRHPRTALVLLAVGLVMIGVALAVGYHFWQNNGEIYLYDYSEFGPVSNDLSLDTLAFGERPGTIIHRLLFLYPMAIDMFFDSPLFGIGFTRFDDFPVQIVGAVGFVAFNLSATVQHTNFHAHNSYLHIAAETGLVGLALLTLFLRSIFRSFDGHPMLATPVQIMLGALMIASMSEHRLTTPSQAAPAFILIGLLWVCRQSKEHSPRQRSPYRFKNSKLNSARSTAN